MDMMEDLCANLRDPCTSKPNNVDSISWDGAQSIRYWTGKFKGFKQSFRSQPSSYYGYAKPVSCPTINQDWSVQCYSGPTYHCKVIEGNEYNRARRWIPDTLFFWRDWRRGLNRLHPLSVHLGHIIRFVGRKFAIRGDASKGNLSI